MIMQHPGNDIDSDLLHFRNKLHFTGKIINLIEVADYQEPSIDNIQNIIQV